MDLSSSAHALHSPVVVMGVSGAGKTTVGIALAAALDVPFVDADDLHSDEARQKMARGEPLTDDDRWPWLARVAARLADPAHPATVIACSALKRVYRDALRAAHEVQGVALLQCALAPEDLSPSSRRYIRASARKARAKPGATSGSWKLTKRT